MSWLARRQARVAPAERIDHVLVLDSDVIVLRAGLVRDAVAALRASGAALAGQKVPGTGSDLVPLACLLLDPRRAWTAGLPPFQDDGAPSQALQEAVLARGLGIADVDFALGSYVLHLGGGTLAQVAAGDDVSNRFYGWARANHLPHYSHHPLGRHLHEAFLALYAAEVPHGTAEALVRACRAPGLLTLEAAQPLPPLDELAALAAEGVDLTDHLVRRFEA